MSIKRVYDKEIIDDLSITDDRLFNALDELKIVNKFLGGNSSSAKALKIFCKSINKNKIDVIDVGAGASDTVYTNHKYINKIISIDKNAGACKYLKNENTEAFVICADTSALPIKNNSIDAVHASLFLHHFTEEELIIIFKEYKRITRYGFIINDLQRAFIPWIGIKLLTMIFSKSKMVKNDGPLSVKRGFRKNELITLFNESGFTNYIIKWKWAFRWIAVVFNK